MKNHHRLLILSFLVLMFGCMGMPSEAMTLESLLPKEDIPDGWALVDGPHPYTTKTLFERVNGQAELFFKYGFQRSVSAIYEDKKKEGNQIELDIYDMGNVLQAFGIFSRFRNEDQPGGIGLDSYLDDQSAFFYKGKYFVMLYTTETNPSILKVVAKRISSKILDPSPPPKEISYFPKQGFRPGSIQYFSEGLLGHQFLERGFRGTYMEKVKAEDKEFTIFLAILKNSPKAIGAFEAYKNHLNRKGKTDPRGSNRFGPALLKGEDPYQGKVAVVPQGFYLAGAVGFINEVEAESLLAELIKNITLKSNPARSF
jgi:hypothetical protein